MSGSPKLADDSSATIFVAGILASIERPVFWCLRWRDLFAPALHLVGVHPGRVFGNVLLVIEPVSGIRL